MAEEPNEEEHGIIASEVNDCVEHMMQCYLRIVNHDGIKDEHVPYSCLSALTGIVVRTYDMFGSMIQKGNINAFMEILNCTVLEMHAHNEKKGESVNSHPEEQQ